MGTHSCFVAIHCALKFQREQKSSFWQVFRLFWQVLGLKYKSFLPSIFCTLEKYLFANFQVKQTFEGQPLEKKMDQKFEKNTSALTRILKKITFKSLLLIHRLTVLAENLQKGTSQECKKFDGSRILNFSFFCYLQHKNPP